MNNRAKAWLVFGVLLIVIGLILFAAAMAKHDWDFTKLSTVKYETNTYEINQDFNDISIKTDTADIYFAASQDGVCRVVCYEEENSKHSAVAGGGTLAIDVVNERKWYENVGISVGSPKITVYLPKAGYNTLLIKESTGDIEIPKIFEFNSVNITTSTGDVNCLSSVLETAKIKSDTGNVCVQNLSSGALDILTSTGGITVSDVTCGGDIKIGVSTGRVNMTDVECQNLISDGSTGDIYLNSVVAKDRFYIERSTGDVRFDTSDANEILIETDTGDVSGSLLTQKIFITQTDTGNVDVPHSLGGGKCEITTDTGDISLDVLN